MHKSQLVPCLQVTIGGERSFTFDYAFDIGTHQQKVYDDCVKNLIEGTFEGFNATVLAYGQVCYSFYEDICSGIFRSWNQNHITNHYCCADAVFFWFLLV